MKNPIKPRFSRKTAQLYCVLLSTPFAFSYVQAADIIKADNTTALNDATSWVGGVLPGASDIAVFNSTLTSGLTVSVGGNLGLKGVRAQANPGNIVISGLTAQAITVGSAGIDLGALSGGTFFEFNPSVTLLPGTAQTWSVGAGASTILWGNLNTAGSTVVLDNSGGKTGVLFAEGFGTSGFIQPSILFKTDSGLNFAMRTAGDYRLAEADASVVVANPSDGGTATLAADVVAAPAEGTYMDVTNSNGLASATAFRAYASLLTNGTLDAGTYWTNSGIRFNQPHATAATDWVVDLASKSLYANNGVFSLLVTENVGARNVIFNGGNNGNAFRYNNIGATLAVHQHNTQGDLILRSSVSARLSNNNFIKSGPGRLIMGNGAFGGTGTVYLNEGVTQLGESNATGTFGGFAVVNNGTLRIQRSDASTFANNLGGAGSISVAGGGITFSGANTYTGATTIESGSLTLASATALGATSSLNLNGGLLTFGIGVNTDITASPVTVGTTTTVNTNGNDVVFAHPIAESAASGLVKTGTGTLTLAAASFLTGASTVGAGTLSVTNTTGSATGTGAITVNNGAVLSGTGNISGAVTVATGAKIAPGAGGLGTLTVGGLSLDAGSLLDLEIASTSSNDRIAVAGAGALSVNGGSINLYSPGTTDAFATPGVYNIFQYSGALGGAGAAALAVQNAQAGYRYRFGTSSGFITLSIDLYGMITNWATNGSGSFATAANWSNGVPSGVGASTNFNTALSGPATVTLDGDRTLGGLSFNSVNSYTLAQGSSGTLYLDNGPDDPAAINIASGSHVISAPVGLVSDLYVSTATSSSLAFTGLVAGTSDLVKADSGTLVFSNTNQIVGNTTVSGGTLEFGSLASIGNGSINLNGGTLRYGAGNTADISARTISIGTNGGGIDTNGNNVTFSNPIGNAGSGSLIKKGAGSLSLVTGNTYSGATVIQGGKIPISANNQLNATGVGVTLDGGTLETTATFSTDRSLNVTAAGGTVEVSAGTTLTSSVALSGSGLLTKSGSGSLILTVGSTKTGGIAVSAGTLSVRNGTAAGAGTLALANGTVFSLEDSNGFATGTSTSTFMGNAISVAAASSVSMQTSGAANGYSGLITGDANSTFNIIGVDQASFSAGANTQQFANFLGTVNIGAGSSLRYSSTSGLTNGGQNTTFNVNGSLTARNAGTAHVGALTGTGTLSGSSGADNNTTIFSIGAKNLDTTFSGVIIDSNVTTGRRAAVVKAGTGTLTLAGTSNYSGATTVNAGTLRIDGSLGATTTTVAAAGTLAGAGTIGGNVTINNGTLRPGTPTAGNAQLTFNGALALSGVATPISTTTQFDFAGATLTGVKTNGTIAYAGTLKLNFTGSIYNGSYTLFQSAVAPTGAFAAVSATSLATPTAITFSESAGTWTGVIDGATLSFTPATGVLAVSGALGAPSAPSAATLSATAANASVNLSWTAASGADTYSVKRALVSGGPYTNVVSGVAGTTYSDTGLVNGTTYYYVVQAKNSSSGLVSVNSNEASAAPVAAPTYTSLQSWRFEQFGVYEDTGAVLAGNTEDFDGDGLANILEYALNTNPTVANASPVVVGKSGNNLTLTYPRRATADAALTYAVQGSSDLTGGFTTAGGATNTVGSTSTYTDNVDVSAAGVRRFLRLSVTYTAP